MIGRRVARFRVLEPLGRGGMAAVWRARDELLGRDVALKILDDALAATVWARNRFQREAEIAAKLEHPAIVPVLDAGEHDGLAYMVMKLVEGETLAQRSARRLQRVDEVLRLADAVLDALEYAHGRGVIHRDVSPRNIMLTERGDIYILDFGLARVMGRGEISSGLLSGTPAYIAPETLLGTGTDARGDLYGLGVVIYEALTGALPFRGSQPAALHFESLHGTVDPPSRLRPELDARTDAFVLRMMARELDRRFESAGAARLELATLHEQLATPPATPSPSVSAAPVLESSPSSAGGLASQFSAGRARAYLAVLPMDPPEAMADAAPRLGELTQGLVASLRAGLARLDRIHVVEAGASPEAPAPAAGEDARTFARRVGANLLLRSSVRFSGTAARVTFALVDPERSAQIAGGTVDGSILLAFELEDRLVAAVREALEVDPASAEPRWRATPHDPAARERFDQALAYLRRFDQEASLDGAIQLLEGLIESEGDSATLHAALARALVAKYRLTAQRTWEARAARACERAARLDPGSPDVALALGDLHAAMGRNLEALAQLDRVLTARPDDYEALLVRSLALEGAGRSEEAEAASRRAIDLRPQDWRGYYGLGLTFFRRARYAEAVDPWSRVITLAPDNAGAHRNLGSTYFRLNQFDHAIEAFRRSIEIRPNAMAFYNLGAALFYVERWEEAVAAFEKAVALNPSDPWTWGNLGNACRWVPGREERMREALGRAVGLMRERLDREPGSGDDWGRLAGWLANMGCRDEAERAARRALEMSPQDASCLASVGHALLAIGRRAEALEVLERALRRGYGLETLRRSPELRALAGAADFERMIEQGSQRKGTVGGVESQP